MKRLFIITLFILLQFLSYAQISFYKRINTHDDYPYAMIISKDNNFAYVAAPTEIQTYSRNDTTGDLTFLSSIKKMQDNTAINTAYSLVLNNSSSYLYLVTHRYTCVFGRDINTGILSPVQTLKNETTPTSNITNSCIVLSKDDEFLYSTIRQNLYIYKIDSATGFLNPIDTLKDLNHVENSDFDVSCEISPDNQLLYITGGHGISVYKRDVSTGLLSFNQEIKGNNFVNGGLTYAEESRVPASNRFVYTVTNSFGSGAIVVLSRDLTADTLSIIQTYGFGYGTPGLVNPGSITISPNNKVLCVNSATKMAMFKIDSVSGKIKYIKTFHSTPPNHYTIGGRNTIDSRNRFLYDCPAFNDSIFIYKFNLFLDDNQDVCSGDTITLATFNDYKDYTWSTGSKDPTIRISAGGNYILSAEDDFQNIHQDTVSVSLRDLPIVSLGNDTFLYKNQSIILTPGYEFQEFSWSINDLFSESHDFYFPLRNDTLYHEEFTETISVFVTDDNGCSNSDTIMVHFLNSIFSVTSPGKFEEFSIYPNPSESFLYFEGFSGIKNKAEIYIYSMSGRLVYQSTADEDTQIDISSFQKGIYLINIIYNHHSTVKKFVKR